MILGLGGVIHLIHLIHLYERDTQHIFVGDVMTLREKKNGAKVIQTLFPKLKFLLRTVLRLSFVFRIMQSIVDE